MNTLKNKKIAILGFGIENQALLEWFKKHEITNVTVCDKNVNLKEQLDKLKVKSKLGKEYLNNLDEFDVVFRTPGIPVNNEHIQEAIDKKVEISSQIKLFFDLCKAKIIGVTGTKGKGTTSSLIYEMLKNDKSSNRVYLSGNIGSAPIEFAHKLSQKDWVILELSSFQLQDLKKSPHIATVLNITSDHLDYHRSKDEYVNAKSSIVRYQKQGDFAVINLDYLTSFKFAALSPSENDWYFSIRKSVDLGSFVKWDENKKSGTIVLRTDEEDIKIISTEKLKLIGKHNLENACAATTVAYLSGVGVEKIKKVLENFKPIEHRLEKFFENKNVFINDSASTNPDTTLAAINSFDQPIILIAGGSDKGLNYDKLGSEIVKDKVKKIFLIGKTQDKIAKCVKDKNIKIFKMDNLEKVIKKLKEDQVKDEIIVFSPASASFDMFKNYIDRGNQFKNIVTKYFK